MTSKGGILKVKELSSYLNADFSNSITNVDLNFKSRILKKSYQDLNSVSFSLLQNLGNINSDCYSKRSKVVKALKKIVSKSLLVNEVIFFIHGSYATGNITAFSDIDVTVIIPDKKISKKEAKNLRKVVRLMLGYIYSVDPLMHHGIEIILACDLSRYDESILPVKTLRSSVALNESRQMNIIVDHELSVINAKKKLVKQCDAVILFKENKMNQSLYKMKGLISVLMLIPVLLLQADVKEFLYKRDAIKRARDLYIEKIPFTAIDMATEFRKDWLVPRHIYYLRKIIVLINPVFPNLQNAQRISGSTAFINKNKADYFIKEAKNFASLVKEYIDD